MSYLAAKRYAGGRFGSGVTPIGASRRAMTIRLIDRAPVSLTLRLPAASSWGIAVANAEYRLTLHVVRLVSAGL